jgi:uncharacterized protein with HEPN domain
MPNLPVASIEMCTASTREQFLHNRMQQLAVQKLIEIVGEALR